MAGQRADWSEGELYEHWNTCCKPLSAISTLPRDDADAPLIVPEHVAEWRRVWAMKSPKLMWTAADAWHIHAISGAVYTVLGAAFLLDTVARDIAALSGIDGRQHMPIEAAFVAMALGAVNAASGLQPALLGPLKDLPRTLGLGPDGNLKSGGFINTSLFYFFLTYQSLRMLPSFPAPLTLLDPVFALATLAAMWHTTVILNAWVQKGALNRLSADGLFAPPFLNLPVSLHLLLQGQTWVGQLSAQYPGWPEVFFVSNFALAWAASMVTFALSLYERRVISMEVRTLILVLLPLLVFSVVPLHAARLIPEWFHNDLATILTLSPPSV